MMGPTILAVSAQVLNNAQYVEEVRPFGPQGPSQRGRTAPPQ